MSRRSVVGVAVDAALSAALVAPDAAGLRVDFGAVVESSGVDFLIVGGERLIRSRSNSVTIDPTVVATVIARHTERVGLVVAAAPRREHPFNIARRLASLDHGAHGRVGWLVGPFDYSTPRYEQAWTTAGPLVSTVDAVAIARELWGSWPAASIVSEADRGVFAESERITYIDHVGAYSVSGPLNVPEPPQAQLPVFWRPLDAAETAAARRTADVVIVPNEAVAQGHRSSFDPDAARDQVLLVDRHWRPGAAIDSDSAADGVIVHGMTVDSYRFVLGELARSSYFDDATPTLRDRLGLAWTESVTVGTRSMFPIDGAKGAAS
ncbi:LLM class flavin-dependent oxidoreductase [Aldersonia kunmingensis]|uniref:LLM class flavin-dependent oxidoreductase n=1 Tax=Aldersonia kunmingensis TaxID=408066 RepID=UPI00083285DB|nr:LLM class flavin-dependent oxidoreductase [Aldersonia kunmingensis]